MTHRKKVQTRRSNEDNNRTDAENYSKVTSSQKDTNGVNDRLVKAIRGRGNA